MSGSGQEDAAFLRQGAGEKTDPLLISPLFAPQGGRMDWSTSVSLERLTRVGKLARAGRDESPQRVTALHNASPGVRFPNTAPRPFLW